MSKIDEKQILENARKIGQKYLDCFNMTGNYDLDTIRKALSGRTHEGKPVKIIVVASKKEAIEVLKPIIKKNPQLQPWNCVWDYYDMAFYDASYSQCPNPNIEFGMQSFYEAFKAGLRYYINLRSLAVAITGPKAHLDPQRRTHKEDGPAVIWGEEKAYYWHGVKMKEKWIMNKDKLTVKFVLGHKNIEQRHALCEIIGWDKILIDLKCEVIQKDEMGELLRVKLPDTESLNYFVKVRCTTRRTFYIPVPSTVKTAKEAVAATYGVDPNNYTPEVRT